MKNKMLIIMVGLLALSLLVVSCGTGETKVGEAQRNAVPFQLGIQSQCNLKKNCDALAALETKVNLLEGKVAELESKLNVGIPTEEYQVCVAEQTGCGIESLGEPTSWGGCPRGTTASSCAADGIHVLCTGSQEFGDVDIDCSNGGQGPAVCTGEAPTAKCSTISVIS